MPCYYAACSTTQWMAVALEEAARARDAGEVPIGAVVVIGRRIVAAGSTSQSSPAIRPRTPRSSRSATPPGASGTIA